jgi:hypothetical protein
MKTPVTEFLNKNEYIDVNPYKNREYNLGVNIVLEKCKEDTLNIIMREEGHQRIND